MAHPLDPETINTLIADGMRMMNAAATPEPDPRVLHDLSALAMAGASVARGVDAEPAEIVAVFQAVRAAYLLGREAAGWG